MLVNFKDSGPFPPAVIGVAKRCNDKSFSGCREALKLGINPNHFFVIPPQYIL